MGKALITSRAVDSDPLKGAYAVVAVEYPEGSMVVCTDGAITRTAEKRWGTWVFGVSHEGEWVLTMSDGVRTATYIITIQNRNQVEYVKMRYDNVLFERGVSNIGWTGSTRGSTGTYYGKIVTSTESGLVFNKPGSRDTSVNQNLYGAAHVITKSPVDLTDCSTLCVTMTTGNTISFGLTDVDSDIAQEWLCASTVTGQGTFELDISSFSGGRHYVVLACQWANGGTQNNTATNVWMK